LRRLFLSLSSIGNNPPSRVNVSHLAVSINNVSSTR
jgi:hypothetical protein